MSGPGSPRRATIPPETALAYFEAVPESWRMSPGDAYPQPVVGLAEGRDRALAAYERHRG